MEIIYSKNNTNESKYLKLDTVYTENKEYNIYSEVLTLDEMIELANGVEVSYAK